MDFSTFRDANVRRCESAFHPLKAWSPTDWATALAGETGEACNEVKKLRRLAESPETLVDETKYGEYQSRVNALGDELGDIVAYADLLAARFGLDLGECVRRKFNEVSDRRKSSIKL